MPPRRRDRRSRRDPSPSPTHPRGPHASSSSPRLRIAFIALPLLLLSLAALHFTGRLYRSPPHPEAPGTTPISVYERGLIKREASAREILAEHGRVSENRSRLHFRNPVLAYVTPWNSKGYDMAKLFSTKLTHVSPVWYDLKSDGNKLVLEGQHNYDAGWVSELQSNACLVVPRVVLEAYPGVVLLKKKPRDKTIDLIVSECRDKGYDGVVLESWSRWAAYGVLDDPELRQLAGRPHGPTPAHACASSSMILTSCCTLSWSPLKTRRFHCFQIDQALSMTVGSLPFLQTVLIPLRCRLPWGCCLLSRSSRGFRQTWLLKEQTARRSYIDSCS